MINRFFLNKNEKRIIEIENVLADGEREKKIAAGYPMEIAKKVIHRTNKPLLAEKSTLKQTESFKNRKLILYINISTILVSLFIAFIIPKLEKRSKEKADIQSLYQTIIANQDIFISNFGSLKNAQNNKTLLLLPELYIDFPIQENIHRIIQSELGLDQYRFILYYIHETQLLNEVIATIRSQIIKSGSASINNNSQIKSYIIEMNYLEDDNWKSSKFNYVHDTSCILHLFNKAFYFLDITKKTSGAICSNNSLNRLYNYFGQTDTPSWLMSELRNALNERENNLGDRLIQDR